jgi:hypothetical protein
MPTVKTELTAKPPKPRPTAEERKLRQHLRDVTGTLSVCLRVLDAVMKEPPSAENGRRVARILNVIEMANDSARHFGLGADLAKDRKRDLTPAEMKRWFEMVEAQEARWKG